MPGASTARPSALADRALALEAEHGPANEQVGARITRAQALSAAGRDDEAEAAWAEAAAAARRLAPRSDARRIFAAWAESLPPRAAMPRRTR